ELLVTAGGLLGADRVPARPASPPAAASAQGLASDDVTFGRLADAASSTRTSLLVGYVEACATGVFLATQLIERSGRAIAGYRCTHLADRRYDPGTWLTVAPCAGVRLGLMLDDDLLVPEVARALALAGAELLIVQCTGSSDPCAAPESEDEMLRAVARCRAFENATPLVVVAPNGGFAVDHRGDAVPMIQNREGIALVSLEPGAGTARFRRPELYRRLLVVDEEAAGRAG
ncbi:MAG: hypothetical protein KDE35_17245, partial [Geminicoccaceae bacterium]|nr:hypothetical protein [Geminicoccaceae bacterium]